MKGVDRVLDVHYAARSERLPLPVVVEEHLLPDAGGNVPLAAEHVRDRLPEEVANLVVDVLDALVAELADVVPVVGDLYAALLERSSAGGSHIAFGRDGGTFAKVEVVLCELYEPVELVVYGIYHGIPPLLFAP